MTEAPGRIVFLARPDPECASFDAARTYRTIPLGAEPFFLTIDFLVGMGLDLSFKSKGTAEVVWSDVVSLIVARLRAIAAI